MKFDKIIGLDFKEISSSIEPFEFENNEFALKLNEGIEEEFYVTAKSGAFEMILDKKKLIETIFLYPNENGVFPFGEFTVEMGRNEIHKKLGKPNSQGEPIDISALGISGGFDRYDKEIVYHFEYKDKAQENLKIITLMSVDIAP